VITNLRRNLLGAVEFDADRETFVVYPIPAGTWPARLTIQSGTRIGWIHLADGTVSLSSPHPDGAGFWALREATPAGALDGEALLQLKAHVEASTAK
jgi:hypothetical protein